MPVVHILLALAVLAEPSTATSAKPVRPKLAVLGLRPLKVEPAFSDILSEVALSEAARFRTLDVVGESDIATLLGHERQQELLGCQEDSACMAQIAGALGAEYLLVGSVGRVGAASRIDLKLLDVRKARVISRTGKSVEGPDDKVMLAVQHGVVELLTPIAGTPVSQEVASATASSYDGHYVGVLSCEGLPVSGRAAEPLRTKMSLKITNAQAEYERVILRPDNYRPIGTEKGTGSVSPSGELSLSATFATVGWDFDAFYKGKFEGRTIKFTGKQTWHMRRRSPFDRECTIVATRSEMN